MNFEIHAATNTQFIEFEPEKSLSFSGFSYFGKC